MPPAPPLRGVRGAGAGPERGFLPPSCPRAPPRPQFGRPAPLPARPGSARPRGVGVPGPQQPSPRALRPAPSPPARSSRVSTQSPSLVPRAPSPWGAGRGPNPTPEGPSSCFLRGSEAAGRGTGRGGSRGRAGAGGPRTRLRGGRSLAGQPRPIEFQSQSSADPTGKRTLRERGAAPQRRRSRRGSPERAQQRQRRPHHCPGVFQATTQERPTAPSPHLDLHKTKTDSGAGREGADVRPRARALGAAFLRGTDPLAAGAKRESRCEGNSPSPERGHAAAVPAHTLGAPHGPWVTITAAPCS